MDKQDIAAYFDGLAPRWDGKPACDEAKIDQIVDVTGVRSGCAVLDVACGTGVLFPYYLSRGAARVTGVDISREMVRLARSKTADSRVEVLCGDMEAMEASPIYDICVVYNAFPHFPEPERLVGRLAQWLKPGGRLTVAHSMSLAELRRRHAGSAARVSRDMLTAEELKELFSNWFDVDAAISDDEKYVVSGLLRAAR